MISAAAYFIGLEIFARIAAGSILQTAAEDFFLVCVAGLAGLLDGSARFNFRQVKNFRCFWCVS